MKKYKTYTNWGITPSMYGVGSEELVELPLKKESFFKRHLTGIIGWTALIIGIISIGVLFYYQNRDNEPIPVSGTVIGKNEGYKSHYKTSSVYSEFYMAVRPDDTSRYNVYDVKTTYATFASHSVGSRVTFNVPKREVIKGYEEYGHYNLFVIIMILSLIIAGSIGANKLFEY